MRANLLLPAVKINLRSNNVSSQFLYPKWVIGIWLNRMTFIYEAARKALEDYQEMNHKGRQI